MAVVITKKELEEQEKELDALFKEQGSSYNEWLYEKQKECLIENAKPAFKMVKDLKKKADTLEKEVAKLKKELEQKDKEPENDLNPEEKPEEQKDTEPEMSGDEKEAQNGEKTDEDIEEISKKTEEALEGNENEETREADSENKPKGAVDKEAQQWGVGNGRQR